MAWDINRVVLVGRASNQIELKYTPSGAAVGRFGLAVGGRPREGQETVSFFNVVVWGKLAENCNSYMTKGMRVAVDGRLEQNTWNAQDGTRRSSVEIVAERVEFLSQSTSEGGVSRPTPAQAMTRPPAGGATRQNTQDYSQPFGEDYYDNSGFDPTPLDYAPEDAPF